MKHQILTEIHVFTLKKLKGKLFYYINMINNQFYFHIPVPKLQMKEHMLINEPY